MPNATPDMYHAWLIRQRVYCARDACFRKPERVMKINGFDTVLCAEHAGRLDAVRQSESKQDAESDCHADAIEALERLEAAQDNNQ